MTRRWISIPEEDMKNLDIALYDAKLLVDFCNSHFQWGTLKDLNEISFTLNEIEYINFSELIKRTRGALEKCGQID